MKSFATRALEQIFSKTRMIFLYKNRLWIGLVILAILLILVALYYRQTEGLTRQQCLAPCGFDGNCIDECQKKYPDENGSSKGTNVMSQDEEDVPENDVVGPGPGPSPPPQEQASSSNTTLNSASNSTPNSKPEPVPAPAQSSLLPLYADLTGQHQYCVHGKSPKCENKKPLCPPGQTRPDCCVKEETITIEKADNRIDPDPENKYNTDPHVNLVTWRCNDPGQPWQGIDTCPDGYVPAHMRPDAALLGAGDLNIVNKDIIQNDTCILAEYVPGNVRRVEAGQSKKVTFLKDPNQDTYVLDKDGTAKTNWDNNANRSAAADAADAGNSAAMEFKIRCLRGSNEPGCAKVDGQNTILKVFNEKGQIDPTVHFYDGSEAGALKAQGMGNIPELVNSFKKK